MSETNINNDNNGYMATDTQYILTIPSKYCVNDSKNEIKTRAQNIPTIFYSHGKKVYKTNVTIPNVIVEYAAINDFDNAEELKGEIFHGTTLAKVKLIKTHKNEGNTPTSFIITAINEYDVDVRLLIVNSPKSKTNELKSSNDSTEQANDIFEYLIDNTSINTLIYIFIYYFLIKINNRTVGDNLLVSNTPKSKGNKLLSWNDITERINNDMIQYFISNASIST